LPEVELPVSAVAVQDDEDWTDVAMEVVMTKLVIAELLTEPMTKVVLA
jgi:hypothetical protein